MNFINVKTVVIGVFLLAVAIHGKATSNGNTEEHVHDERAHGCGGLRKHISIDTWINEEMYQQLLDIGFPIEQSKAISEVNQVASIYAYPGEFLHESQIRAAITHINKTAMIEDVATFSAFHTRHYLSATGLESANWLFGKATSIAAASNNPGITVEKFAHTWQQPSIIARFIGSQPSLPRVIIGAHQDSINGGSSARSPGADDNASGSITLLEVFKILAGRDFDFRPTATVEFHWYAAEEVGLLGAKAISADYRANGVPVVAMLNYDIVGYTSRSAQKHIAVITDFVDASLTAFLRSAIDKFSTLPRVDDRCAYACSDHAAWTSSGFPAAHIYEATGSEISPVMHSAQDTIETVDFDHLVEFAKVGLGYLIELGNRGSWPK